jgi:hypothetical protein
MPSRTAYSLQIAENRQGTVLGLRDKSLGRSTENTANKSADDTNTMNVSIDAAIVARTERADPGSKSDSQPLASSNRQSNRTTASAASILDEGKILIEISIECRTR